MKAVKYCGGCNPRYERREAQRRLEEQLGEALHYAEKGVHYDTLYVINGCTAACADLSEYEADIIVSLTQLPETMNV